jgi:uncharacterized protein (TIGR03118 family)
VNAFDLTGKLMRRVVDKGGSLDAPWAMAIVPDGFGAELTAGALLVGNFGDGTITTVDAAKGVELGQLQSSTAQQPLSIDGLWGIAFTAADQRELYFGAGPNTEMHGQFGKVVSLQHCDKTECFAARPELPSASHRVKRSRG